MKIMITGAAGFIGRRLARWLTVHGDSTILVDNEYLFLTRPSTVKNVRYSRCVSPEDAWRYIDEVDCVVHLGANSSTSESNFAALLENNVRYSISLIDKAVQLGKGFIFVSSAGVYGNSVCSHNKELLTPITPYGVSKAHVESYITNRVVPSLFSKSNKVVIARPFNVYGLGESTKPVNSQSLIYRLAWSACKGDHSLKIHSLDASRDFVFVEDVALALRNLCQHVLSILRPNVGARHIFDIGTCVAPAVRDVVQFSRGKFSFSPIVDEQHKAPATYQTETVASWSSDYPYDSTKFLSWETGLTNMFELLKMGAEE